jgi:hypothetical protein
MANTIDIQRSTRLRKLHTDAKGNHHLGGRWSLERIAQVLIESRNKRWSLDDLARYVYGTTGKKYRDNVRKHIPAQRNHMLARMVPFVTKYGPRGIIVDIKLYQSDDEQDRMYLSMELDRLHHRGEITRDRYQKLCEVLRLPAPVAGGE